MIQAVLLSLYQSRLANVQDPAPAGSVCFAVANSSSPLLTKDLAELKKAWKSKVYLKLSSGNFGIFQNGCYFLISKDVPLIKGLRDRFELTNKIIELAKDGRSKICQVGIKGQEFSETQIETLNKLVDRWTGMRYSSQELIDQGSMKFVFSSVASFSNGGESFSIHPSYSYPSDEFREFVRKNAVRPGILTELSAERRKESFERNKDSSIIGVEAPEGAVSVRVFNVTTEKPDISSNQKEILDQIDKVFQTEAREYRRKIVESSKPIREFENYLFKDFEISGVSEKDQDLMRSDLLDELRRAGYSRQEAESRIEALKPSGKDFLVSMQTRIKSFGFEVSNYSVTIRIWP